jgi:hypothetical protein
MPASGFKGKKGVCAPAAGAGSRILDGFEKFKVQEVLEVQAL